MIIEGHAMKLPRIRFKVRRLIVAIACLGLGLVLLRSANRFFSNTAYSVHYSERRFNSIRPGMTPAEVEGVMGSPLHKDTYAHLPGGDVNRVDWRYSEQIDATRDFWRRHVVFKDGKVWYLVNERWED